MTWMKTVKVTIIVSDHADDDKDDDGDDNDRRSILRISNAAS